MQREQKKILAVLPVSIGGRLTMNSIIDGFCKNNYSVIVFDELYDNNLQEILSAKYDYISGYNYSAVKIKIDHNLKIPSINYFSDDMRTKAGGDDWEKYIKYLKEENNYTFYWDKDLTKYENYKNIYYLPHFVSFDIYKDLGTEPAFDVMFAGRLDSDYRLHFFEQLLLNLPNLKIAWFAIDKHYQDAKRRTKYPDLIKKAYQGFIDNETDMSKAINNTKIVFNMNSQGISSLNYRTFQTAACKRLMISDYRDDLALFSGKMPYYEDFSSLLLMINHFLEDKKQYKIITEICYKIAQKNHNATDCIKYIMSKIP